MIYKHRFVFSVSEQRRVPGARAPRRYLCCFGAKGSCQLPSRHIGHSWLRERRPPKTHKNNNTRIQLGVVEQFDYKWRVPGLNFEFTGCLFFCGTFCSGTFCDLRKHLKWSFISRGLLMISVVGLQITDCRISFVYTLHERLTHSLWHTETQLDKSSTSFPVSVSHRSLINTSSV